MAKKEAGLIYKKPVGGIGVRGNSTVVAKRIIKTICKESALKLANQIMEVLK